ncbi:hypothetical protein [uncultured Clostridium sp.]|uniref:hypothetical protein n=1 Tax=uncultured Clostridium sp. TaxID=59620 RepID=UPI0025EDD6E1|nr:hypothetical protein [uncultured Clostridium sp.]
MSELKVNDLTEENNVYANILCRCLINDGYPLNKFSNDGYEILSLVNKIININFKDEKIYINRARIEVNINVAGKSEDDRVYTVSKVLKEDSGEFVLEE